MPSIGRPYVFVQYTLTAKISIPAAMAIVFLFLSMVLFLIVLFVAFVHIPGKSPCQSKNNRIQGRLAKTKFLNHPVDNSSTCANTCS